MPWVRAAGVEASATADPEQGDLQGQVPGRSRSCTSGAGNAAGIVFRRVTSIDLLRNLGAF